MQILRMMAKRKTTFQKNAEIILSNKPRPSHRASKMAWQIEVLATQALQPVFNPQDSNDERERIPNIYSLTSVCML